MIQYYLISGRDNNKVNLATTSKIKAKVTDEGILLNKEDVDGSNVAGLVQSFNPQIINIPTDPSGSL